MNAIPALLVFGYFLLVVWVAYQTGKGEGHTGCCTGGVPDYVPPEWERKVEA